METNLKGGDVGSQQAATLPPAIMVQPWWRGPVFGAMPPSVILPENMSGSKETGDSSQGDANSENENSAKEKGKNFRSCLNNEVTKDKDLITCNQEA